MRPPVFLIWKVGKVSIQSSAALSKLIFNSINLKHLPNRREQIKLETLVHLGHKSIKLWCHCATNVIILALKHRGEEKVMLQKKTNVIFVSTHSFFFTCSWVLKYPEVIKRLSCVTDIYFTVGLHLASTLVLKEVAKQGTFSILHWFFFPPVSKAVILLDCIYPIFIVRQLCDLAVGKQTMSILSE